MRYSDKEIVAIVEELKAKARTAEALAVVQRSLNGLPLSRWYREYDYGLESLLGHIRCSTPEVLNGGMRVVEVGPGVGCFMAIAKALGNTVSGEELPPQESQCVAAYQAITKYWGLDIRYHGFHRYLYPEQPVPYCAEEIDLFHFRGSLDGVLLPHQDRLPAAVHALIRLFEVALKPGGAVWISHNTDRLLEPITAAIRSLHGGLILTCDDKTRTRLQKPKR